MSPPDAERPPALDRRPLESSPDGVDGPNHITTPGGYRSTCVRGDCRGQGCPLPCVTPASIKLIADALDRIADRLDAWDTGGRLDVGVTP